MQFLSQAMGWADCIALAMAPLGIITILVSAIRVGGPMMLKAVIGRAKENISAAEMELMSSTSQEVCELYNGESFIRCQGTAPVWEYICILPKHNGSLRKLSLQFMTLEKAVKKDLIERSPPPDDGQEQKRAPPDKDPQSRTVMPGIFVVKAMKSLLNKMRPPIPPANGNSDEERASGSESHKMQAPPTRPPDPKPAAPPEPRIIVIRDISPNAPNISINLQDSQKRIAIRSIAVLDVVLQAGVLAFFGTISYNPRVRPDFQKDDGPAAPYGFHLAAGGTILLLFDVFLCALVVENSTQETLYKAKADHDLYVCWIQQSQTVSDQVFDSFVTFPVSPRRVTSIMKSSRHKDLRKGSQGKERKGALPIRTIIGVTIGLLGFIFQFIGLRAMNSAASLAQLAAVGIMTICRALVRPGFASTFGRAKLIQGFELDWLAWRLVTWNPAGEGWQPFNQRNQLDQM
ncbi:hypothetical protein ACHAPT_012280 [Fusarium lateritium]